MSTVSRIYSLVRNDPLRVIEFLWALFLIVNGAYLLLPDYVPATGSVLAAIAGGPIVGHSIAVLYIIVGLVTIYAGWRNTRRWRNVSSLGMFMAFLFTVIIRLITVGPVPTVWIYPLMLTVSAIVVNLHINWRERPDGDG